MGRRDLNRRRPTPGGSGRSFLQPGPRSTAWALVGVFDAKDLASARELIASTPAEDIPDLLLALTYIATTLFPGWVEARGFAEDPYYEGLSGAPLRTRLLRELLAAAASNADGISDLP